MAPLPLFRGMREAADGSPQIGPTSRSLGARPGIDIPAQQPGDAVVPGQGGVSVSPHDPANLPIHRRPQNLGGRGNDPVWSIDVNDLGPDLVYRPDPDDPARHGFLEPSHPMTLQEYQQALALLRSRWQKVSI